MTEFNPLMLLLLILYWLAHRHNDGKAIADALALNWAINQAMVMCWQQAGWGGAPLLVFWTVDLITAAWLVLFEASKLSRRVAWWFIPMLALNAAIWASGVDPAWHYYTLLGLALSQALTLFAGLWGHGILEALDNSRDRLRHKLASAFSFIGEKR